MAYKSKSDIDELKVLDEYVQFLRTPYEKTSQEKIRELKEQLEAQELEN